MFSLNWLSWLCLGLSRCPFIFLEMTESEPSHPVGEWCVALLFHLNLNSVHNSAAPSLLILIIDQGLMKIPSLSSWFRKAVAFYDYPKAQSHSMTQKRHIQTGATFHMFFFSNLPVQDNAFWPYISISSNRQRHRAWISKEAYLLLGAHCFVVKKIGEKFIRKRWRWYDGSRGSEVKKNSFKIKISLTATYIPSLWRETTSHFKFRNWGGGGGGFAS